MSKDLIKRYLSKENIKLSMAITTNLVNKAANKHKSLHLATAALGRTLTGAILLASDFKNNERISLKIKGDGPLGGIYADFYDKDKVRGYVDSPLVELPLNKNKLAVSKGVGEGFITVQRFSELNKTYTSQTELYSGEIAEDIAHYLLQSEQIRSTISLGVMVAPNKEVISAGGFFIQALPNASEKSIEIVENNIKDLLPISNYLKENSNGEGLVEKIFNGLNYHQVYESDLYFKCTCTREKILATLITLQEDDKKTLINDSKIELVCHYCSEIYVVSKDELVNLFNKE